MWPRYVTRLTFGCRGDSELHAKTVFNVVCLFVGLCECVSHWISSLKSVC